MKLMFVFGTRPEAIKMCPLIKEAEACPEMESIVCLTGQHREMLQQVIEVFDTPVHYSLDIMQPNQNLFTVTAAVLQKLKLPLERERPDIVLVHGDTTTTFAAALSSFYMQIPVGHVEAGLRTGDRYSPFPEEMNRTMTGRIAELHFAPTEGNRRNLEAEGVCTGVFVTGNTVIDAFKTTLRDDYIFSNDVLNGIFDDGKRIVLLTAHRRENLGEPLEHIFSAIRRLHEAFPDIRFVYPVHLNPQVREPAGRILDGLERVLLTDPLDVTDMHNLMAKSYLVMTDSGGLQEEAPYCGVPVLVLRTETERPEAAEAGTVRVVGVEAQAVFDQTARLLTDRAQYDRMARAVNPYGDGNASGRIVRHLLEWHHARTAAGILQRGRNTDSRG